jgi:hypothetical protein
MSFARRRPSLPRLLTAAAVLAAAVLLIGSAGHADQLGFGPPPAVDVSAAVAAQVAEARAHTEANEVKTERMARRGGGDGVWDRLAQCESSGDWQANTGNGYYGGLQFHPRTWRAFKPSGYPALAHKATPKQQIDVAKRVLATQGWNAWPACSRKLGLRNR